MYYNYNALQMEVRIIADTNSRADYMRKRREGKKTFSALIDRDKAEGLEKKLKKENKSKTLWLEEKISEELKK